MRLTKLLEIAEHSAAIDIDVDKNGAVDVEFGGTNAKTPAGARANLGLKGLATVDDAPNDGTGYVRKGGQWAPESGGTSFLDIHAQTEKTTPVDADEMTMWDSVSTALRKVTWANIKATLKTYFDTLYAAVGHNHDAAYLSAAYDTTLGSDLSYDGRPVTITAGEAIAFGDVLFKNLADGEWYKAVGGATADALPCAVMCLGTAADGQTVSALRSGYVRNDAWAWTVDGTRKALYASTSVAGEVIEDPAGIAAGEWSQVVGEINSANTIFFNPGVYFQKDPNA